jgi:hypothetical protein
MKLTGILDERTGSEQLNAWPGVFAAPGLDH